MEALKNKLAETGQHLYELFETHSELKKLQTVRKASSGVASLAAVFVVLFMFFFFVVFAGITLAFLIGEWTGHTYIGFLVITGVYLFKGIFLYIYRDYWIRRPLMNLLVKNLLSNDEED